MICFILTFTGVSSVLGWFFRKEWRNLQNFIPDKKCGYKTINIKFNILKNIIPNGENALFCTAFAMYKIFGHNWPHNRSHNPYIAMLILVQHCNKNMPLSMIYFSYHIMFIYIIFLLYAVLEMCKMIESSMEWMARGY